MSGVLAAAACPLAGSREGASLFVRLSTRDQVVRGDKLRAASRSSAEEQCAAQDRGDDDEGILAKEAKACGPAVAREGDAETTVILEAAWP